mmetsp:Transcript_123497/g.214176  ORF Transcript_123497/g.214176 Transcript_123497/m.214176 type:complete len:262 (+) Transcript_123497:1371-2156(+)
MTNPTLKWQYCCAMALRTDDKRRPYPNIRMVSLFQQSAIAWSPALNPISQVWWPARTRTGRKTSVSRCRTEGTIPSILVGLQTITSPGPAPTLRSRENHGPCVSPYLACCRGLNHLFLALRACPRQLLHLHACLEIWRPKHHPCRPGSAPCPFPFQIEFLLGCGLHFCPLLCPCPCSRAHDAPPHCACRFCPSQAPPLPFRIDPSLFPSPSCSRARPPQYALVSPCPSPCPGPSPWLQSPHLDLYPLYGIWSPLRPQVRLQ